MAHPTRIGITWSIEHDMSGAESRGRFDFTTTFGMMLELNYDTVLRFLHTYTQTQNTYYCGFGKLEIAFLAQRTFGFDEMFLRIRNIRRWVPRNTKRFPHIKRRYFCHITVHSYNTSALSRMGNTMLKVWSEMMCWGWERVSYISTRREKCWVIPLHKMARRFCLIILKARWRTSRAITFLFYPSVFLSRHAHAQW